MVLIFVGTLDQVNLGIYGVLKKYFHSFVVFYSFPNSQLNIPVLPGGYSLGGILLINLITAHISRFKMTWKKSGIFLIHIGLILLLLSELFTGLFSKESRLVFDEGQTKNYSEAFRETEFVIIDTSNSDFDQVYSVPENVLKKNDLIDREELPFKIKVHQFYGNTNLVFKNQIPRDQTTIVTHGVGLDLVAIEVPLTGKMNERNIVTAIIEFIDDGKSLGVWMVSNALTAPQKLVHQGKEYAISFRQTRYYKPFTVKLIDFTHDRYPGTDVPKNFSSLVHLVHPAHNEDREVLIYMNHPLRYEGFTFFQSGFDNNDTTSILQVVKNPYWLIPYISCALMSIGLITQFSMHLVVFIKRRSR